MKTLTTAHIFPTPADRLAFLLKEAALLLFNEGVIFHPSNAAIATYDAQHNVAQYVRLFHDWLPDWAHLRYHDVHLHDELQEFQSDAKRLRDAGNRVAIEFASDYLAKPDLGQLEIIGEQLKRISFYSPATANLLDSLQVAGHWSVTDLDYEYLVKSMPGRTQEEAKAGKEGHWRYGVELEKIYLQTVTGSVFGEYFFHDKQTNQLFAITASCINRSRAQGLVSLDRAFLKLRREFAPFSAQGLGSQAGARKVSKAATKIPNAAEFTKRLEQVLNHQDRDKRAKMIADIEALTSDERIALDALIKPRTEKTISLIAMEDLLTKARVKTGVI